MNKFIRINVKRDRANWLEMLAASNDLGQVRKVRKGFAPKQGRLRNANGDLVSNELRATTLADHLEKVQWVVRTVTVAPLDEPLGEVLPASTPDTTTAEVLAAARKLKQDRAEGPDGIPPEYWKEVRY